jgi:hypothetical protein
MYIVGGIEQEITEVEEIYICAGKFGFVCSGH